MLESPIIEILKAVAFLGSILCSIFIAYRQGYDDGKAARDKHKCPFVVENDADGEDQTLCAICEIAKRCSDVYARGEETYANQES